MKSISSNAIIAIVTFLAFLFSIYQNWQTSSLLASANQALGAQGIALVKAVNYKWATTKSTVSCEDPAEAIKLTYRNLSPVPVSVEHLEMSLSLGEKVILSGPSGVNMGEGVLILAPGEAKSHTRQGEEAIKKAFSSLRGPSTVPYVILKFTTIYRSLATGKQFKYCGEFTITESCDQTKHSLNRWDVNESLLQGDDIEVLGTACGKENEPPQELYSKLKTLTPGK